MAKTLFSIDGQAFDHIRVLSCTQTFEILDNENSKRTMDGVMHRGVIGTYYNYKLKLKPEKTAEGMRQYNELWDICSNPSIAYHTIVVPYDVGTSVTHNTQTFEAYITSGSRDMEKYDLDDVDYWGAGEFQFVAKSPKRTP